jgi:penicillin amidase
LRESYLLNDALDRLVLGPAGAPWWRGARDERIRAAFRSAVDTLAAEFGADVRAWRWDAGHAMRFDHELAKALPLLAPLLSRGPYPWGGGSATVGRARERYDRPGIANYGATVRVVAEMADPMHVHAVIPGGQSGHPLDSHYDDQIPLWLRGEQDALATSYDEATGSLLHLEPGPAARF